MADYYIETKEVVRRVYKVTACDSKKEALEAFNKFGEGDVVEEHIDDFEIISASATYPK